MEEKYKNEEIWFDPVYIYIERWNEDEKENREDSYLSENDRSFFIFCWKKKTVQYKSQWNSYQNSEKSYQRKYVWKYTWCLERTEKYIGKKQYKKSSEKSCCDTSESGKSNGSDIYFGRTQYIFISFFDLRMIHRWSRWEIIKMLQHR